MGEQIKSVKVLDNYKIVIKFETGETKIFDVAPYIKGKWYGQLKDKKYFKNISICGKTICWENGQDIAPHELYELSVNVNEDQY